MRMYKVVVISLVLGSILILGLGLPSMAADDRVEKNVRIPRGDDQYWRIETHGKIDIVVDVVEGGAVDVLITEDEPVGIVYYYEQWTNTKHLERTFSTGEDTEVYLLIDNSDQVGVDTVGDVLVHVEWEIRGETSGYLLSILVPIVLVIVIISVVVRVATRGRAAGTGPDEVIVEDIYVDEQGRPIERVVRRPTGQASGMGTAETEWCPNCGAQLRPHPGTGRLFCLQCATKARPPPRPPRQDE